MQDSLNLECHHEKGPQVKRGLYKGCSSYIHSVVLPSRRARIYTGKLNMLNISRVLYWTT